ncbi:MAG: 30S ribosome-binding factor RbfA [Legionellaceae bacterium]
MSADFKRTDRIAEMMQRKLSYLIQQEVNDPRLPKFVTISGVRVANDLSHSKVYFTAIHDEPKLIEMILNQSAPLLRKALARTSTLRTVPQLHFVYDESIDYGKRLSRLIDDVNPPASDVDE